MQIAWNLYLLILIPASLAIRQDSIFNTTCDEELSFLVELWNNTGINNVIGNPIDAIDGYEKSEPWSVHGPYHPRKFDLKIRLFDNKMIYQSKDSMDIWDLSIRMRFKVGEGRDGRYPLNPKIVENVPIVLKKKIYHSLFTGTEGNIVLTFEDIELEKYFFEYKNHINQIIFEVVLENEEINNYCEYEYIFFMASS